MSADVSWSPIRQLRTHKRVIAQIEEKILDGNLRVGDRLPPERELAETLGVSRASVREALRVLEAMGIIDAHVGSGPNAGSTVSSGSTEALSNLLRLHMALAQFEITDLVETRVELERWAADRAARKASVSDLQHMRNIVSKMSTEGIELEQFNELDTEFHVSIARASGNLLVADLMQALRNAVRTRMTAIFERLPDWRETAKTLIEEHTEILRAIECNDPKSASQAIEKHIMEFYHSHTRRDEL